MNEFEQSFQKSEVKTLNGYINDTFKWLVLGIVITFVTAFTLENTSVLESLYSNPLLPIIFAAAEIGIALYLGVRVFKLNPMVAKILYIVYAVLTGVSFAVLIAAYTDMAVSMAFLICALYFGILVLVGSYTKMDLSKIGTLCYIGLFVYCIYAIFALIFNLGDFLLPFISLALFTGITAYDMQKTIGFYHLFQSDPVMLQRLSIFSAFNLYLDFINIFIDILRIIGDSD